MPGRAYSLALFLGLLALFSNSALAIRCGTLYGVVDENKFATNRFFSDYAYLLGEGFIRDYKALKKNGHWIDSGAGNLMPVYQHFSGKINLVDERVADIALYVGDQTDTRSMLNKPTLAFYKFMNWFRKDSRRGDPIRQANITAISYKTDGWLMGQGPDIKPPAEKFTLHEGKFFEDIRAGQLTDQFGKADLITDVFGVLSYTDNPSLVLRTYLASLKKNGAIHVLAGINGDRNGLYREKVKTENGTMTFVEWLEANPTLDVKVTRTTPFSFPGYKLNETTVVEIRLKPGVDPVIAELALVGDPKTHDSKGEIQNPPLRRFREIRE